MKNKAVFSLFLMFLTALSSMGSAQAQQCDPVAEEIITLREPIYRTPMVWGAAYGVLENYEKIAGLVLAHQDGEEEDGIIVAGNFAPDPEGKKLAPFIARLDRRGRVVWEIRDEKGTGKIVKHLVKQKDGYVVLGDIHEAGKGEGIFLARYNKTGKTIQTRPIYASGAKLEVGGFVEAPSGGFYVAATLIPKKDDAKREAVLYRLNSDGEMLWRRKYSPGLKTLFHNIQSYTDGDYILGGAVEQEDGRMGGWIMAVDKDGGIRWQQQYRRGKGASLHDVQVMDDKTMIAAGNVMPADNGNDAGWVIKLDATGKTIWQRYYTGKYTYQAHNILRHEDGRFTVLLSAEAGEHDPETQVLPPRNHSRLLTLSPRGYLLNAESFTDGANAGSVQVISGHNNERYVAGALQKALPQTQEEIDADVVPTMSYDGWIFAATSLDPYQDPCQSNP